MLIFKKSLLYYIVTKNKMLMRCVICYNEIKGYGNNAEPIKSGYCCDTCNYLYVLPKRLQMMRDRK